MTRSKNYYRFRKQTNWIFIKNKVFVQIKECSSGCQMFQVDYSVANSSTAIKKPFHQGKNDPGGVKVQP